VVQRKARKNLKEGCPIEAEEHKCVLFDLQGILKRWRDYGKSLYCDNNDDITQSIDLVWANNADIHYPSYLGIRS